MAVVHSHSPSVIPFGVTRTKLRPVYHMGSFLWSGAPVFEIRNEKKTTISSSATTRSAERWPARSASATAC